MPGAAKVCVPGLKDAVSPVLSGMVRSAEALACTAGLPSEAAITVRPKAPCTAKETAVVVIGTVCEAPAASVALARRGWRPAPPARRATGRRYPSRFRCW